MNIDRELYEDVILDHNRNPFHYMENLPQVSHRGYGFNPTCGDEFTLSLHIEAGLIRRAAFEGVGCAVSVAATSMMTRALEGLNIQEAESLFRRMTAFLHGRESVEGVETLGDLAILGGILDYPDRIKCANLPWHILHAALRKNVNTVCTE